MEDYSSGEHGNPEMESEEGCGLISSAFSFSSLNHTLKMLFSLEVWYAMSLRALVVLIMLCHRPLASLMRLRPFASWKRKLTAITSTNVLRVQRFLGCIYIAANGFAMGWVLLGSSNLASRLLMRSGSLASINMVPLFFGGRTSLLADWAGLSLHAYYTMHHWAGW